LFNDHSDADGKVDYYTVHLSASKLNASDRGVFTEAYEADYCQRMQRSHRADCNEPSNPTPFPHTNKYAHIGDRKQWRDLLSTFISPSNTAETEQEG